MFDMSGSERRTAKRGHRPTGSGARRPAWSPRSGAALLVVGLVVALSPAPAQAASCSVKNSKTLRSGKLVRVYSVPVRGEGGEKVTACHRPTGRRAGLVWPEYQDAGEELLRDTLRVNGPHVALAYSWDGSMAGGIEVLLADVRTAGPDRRRVRRLSPGPGRIRGSGPYRSVMEPIDVELTRRGSLAWLSRPTGEGQDRDDRCVSDVFEISGCEVHRYDAHGGHRVLDRGVDPDPAAFRRAGSRIEWTKAGEPRSAAFR